ncbi:MAG: hypothetical protein IPN29_17655 [Saprospiraceae bacterium]|nr:hypothetical protein [Saprospiraceae bacterium]
MGLLKENYYLVARYFAIALCMAMVPDVWSQQSCIVRVAEEPVSQKVIVSPRKISQINSTGQTEWTGMSGAVKQDSLYTSAKLLSQNYSGILTFSDLGLKLPEGALVKGIKVIFEGRREGEGNLRETTVRLIAPNTKSDNQAGKAYSTINIWGKGSTDRKWSYGFDYYDWGVSWTSEQLNDPTFGLELQLLNFSSKPVTVFVDFIQVEVTYEPLATFCLTDCFPVYVDAMMAAGGYYWQIPPGFEMTSKSEKHNVIDFKISYARPGIYPLCVDIVDYEGKMIDQCCRDIRIKDCTPSTVGNFVWNDINYNGLQDMGEPGLKDIAVELRDENHQLIKTATTNTNGFYQFTGLTEGTYLISVKLPSTYLVTLSNITNEALNSNFKAGLNETAPFYLPFGSNLTDLDFGLVKKLKIGDFVWEDKNYNGQQDAGEPGMAAVPVTLFNESGNEVAKTTTSTNGQYAFDNVPAAKYALFFDVGAVFHMTSFRTGLATADSDAGPGNKTPLINFENKSADIHIDAGFFRYASIGDFVWNDLDANGRQAADEPGTPGIKLFIRNGNGLVVDSVLTDNQGKYTFSNLTPGNYSIRVILPPNTQPTLPSSDPKGSDLIQSGSEYVTNAVNLISGQNELDTDLGYYEVNAVIGGMVWRDDNHNGQMDAGEKGVPDVPVALTDENLQVLSTQISDASGKYLFDELPRGKYFIIFSIEDSLQYTDANIGSDETDSDVLDRIDVGSTDLIQLDNSDTLKNISAGLTRRSFLGDFIWYDADYDGQQDVSEAGVGGVSIELFDESGNPVAQTVSDTDGYYAFEKLIKGTYAIRVTLPEKHMVTRYQTGSGSSDSDLQDDGGTALIVMPLGEDRKDIDGGIILELSLGDFVWEDSNADGIQDANEAGLADISVSLYDENNNLVATTHTDPFGKYAFTSLASRPYSLQFEPGNDFRAAPKYATVPDTDSDINASGRTDLIDFTGKTEDKDIDAGFYRTACIGDYVWLDEDGNGLQNTDDHGLVDVLLMLYTSDQQLVEIYVTETSGAYQFCNLIPGSYYIEVVPVRGYFPTLSGAGSVILDGSITPFFTPVFTVVSGQFYNDIDLGLVYRPQAKLCGKVFDDQNASGSLDLAEAGLANEKVELLDWDFNLLRESTTLSNGDYCFEGLSPGDYYVRFYIADSLQFTYDNVGSDAFDSDAIGLIDIAVTPAITLLPAIDINNVHAGVTRRSDVGGFVWFDFKKDGLYQPGEPGIPDVNVVLFDEAGSVVAAMTTQNAAPGKYRFDKVVRGKYKLGFQINPNFEFTLKDVDPLLGSDVNSDGYTDLIEVLPNLDYNEIDAGYALKGGGINGTVWQDVNKDSLKSGLDKPIANTGVYLFNSQQQLVANTLSDEKGNYTFYPVAPGDYHVVFDSLMHFSFVQADMFFIYSDVDHTYGRGSTRLITLVDGMLEGGVDCGLYDERGSISGWVWEDVNGDGKRDVGEAAISGLPVRLIGGGAEVDTVYSNSEGYYRFDQIVSGWYELYFEQNDTALVTTMRWAAANDTLTDSDVGESGRTDSVFVNKCDRIDGINAGYRGFGSIEGGSFVDINENGFNEEGGGLDDILIHLLDVNDAVVAVASTTTIGGLSGSFNLDKIPAGKYRIKVRRPLFYIFTDKDAGMGAMEDIDSDVELVGNVFAYSDYFQLTRNEVIDALDFGLIFRTPAISSVSGQVWQEQEIDGLRDVAELPEKGVELILYAQSGTELARIQTDTLGKYTFGALTEGYYYIQANLSSGKTFTYYLEGQDKTVDSDFNDKEVEDATPLFYLSIAQDTTHVDLGITGELVLGDYVWDDANDDGIQDPLEAGLEGVNISLIRQDGKRIKEVQSSADGFYSIDNVPGGSYILHFDIPAGYSAGKQNAGSIDKDSDIDEDGTVALATYVAPAVVTDLDAGFVRNGSVGDFIWIDFNANGIQDVGEPGIDTTQINLYDESGNWVASTASFQEQSSGVSGKYVFDQVRPGRYSIEVLIPEGYQATRSFIGGNQTDSDIDANGDTPVFTVLPGQIITDLDAGIYLPGCIGNRVWIDENKNGIQDAGESGLQGINVVLYRSNGVQVASGITDAEGLYLFNDLAQGLYYSQFTIQAPYIFTIAHQGDEDLDSDADADGITPLISLSHGAKYFDLDAGVFIQNEAPESAGRIDIVAAINDHEADIYPVSPNPAIHEISIRVPFEGAILMLFDANGKKLDEWKADASVVRYPVRNLQAGIYYLQFESGKQMRRVRFFKAD